MIIVYKSNTGYTEQYAKLLGDALDMPRTVSTTSLSVTGEGRSSSSAGCSRGT